MTKKEEIRYSYVACDDNISRIQYATLRRSVDNGQNWTNVERMKYTYYGHNESFAPVGALKTATKQFSNGSIWNGTDTHYYRYYKVGESNGFAYALKYIVEPADYQRLAAAVADPFTASNATVAQYATKYYEYNDQRRVVREKVYGGTESYQFSFSTGSLSKNVNSWTQKTTETYADGSIKTVYTNHDGQILLTEEAASSSYYWSCPSENGARVCERNRNSSCQNRVSFLYCIFFDNLCFHIYL